MNVAVYYPILKLSGLVQHEPLGLFCWQLPFGLLETLAMPKLCSRRLQTWGFAQNHRKAGTVWKKKIPCRNSAMGKIFVSTSSCWCHIARDKRSLQRNQRMEMGFEVALPRTNLWCCWHHCLEDGQLVLFLPAPCRDKCTILHQIRSW